MSDRKLPVPVWKRPKSGQSPSRQLALTATMAWAHATAHFTGDTFSALSKRFSAPEAEPGSNQKYFYRLSVGKNVLQHGPSARYGYDLLAEVDRHPLGGRATRYYYQPWELLHPDITLDSVLKSLFDLGPQIASALFYSPFAGLEQQPAWLRRQTDIPSEMAALNHHLLAGQATEGDHDSIAAERQYDVFVALWCLYREAELRRDTGRVLFYRRAVERVSERLQTHSVFRHVFAAYQTLVPTVETSVLALLPAACAQQRDEDAAARGKPTHVAHFDENGLITRIEMFAPDGETEEWP